MPGRSCSRPAATKSGGRRCSTWGRTWRSRRRRPQQQVQRWCFRPRAGARILDRPDGGHQVTSRSVPCVAAPVIWRASLRLYCTDTLPSPSMSRPPTLRLVSRQRRAIHQHRRPASYHAFTAQTQNADRPQRKNSLSGTASVAVADTPSQPPPLTAIIAWMTRQSPLGKQVSAVQLWPTEVHTLPICCTEAHISQFRHLTDVGYASWRVLR
jgi:hypothetical protein